MPCPCPSTWDRCAGPAARSCSSKASAQDSSQRGLPRRCDAPPNHILIPALSGEDDVRHYRDALAQLAPHRFELSADGEEMSDPYLMVEVLTSRVGPDIVLASGISPNGRLSLGRHRAEKRDALRCWRTSKHASRDCRRPRAPIQTRADRRATSRHPPARRRRNSDGPADDTLFVSDRTSRGSVVGCPTLARCLEASLHCHRHGLGAWLAV